jgi:hypothetical protein
VLEVVHDPEITGEKYLVAFILVEIDVEESCEALDRLDQDWELDALLDRAEDRLQIVLEHR